jgi:hypothetical protein
MARTVSSGTKVSDLVYKIQVGKREVNLHVEQLNMCRATQAELRESRRQNRWRMKEQRPRPEIMKDSHS